MAPFESAETTGVEGPDDAFCRAVRVVLAIYLLPVVAVVCAIGGASIALDRAARLAGRLSSRPRVAAAPHVRAFGRAAARPAVHLARRRSRVRH